MRPSKTAFVFVTHFVSEDILFEFKKISLCSKGMGHAWFVFQTNQEPERKIPPAYNSYFCTDKDLESLPYQTPGSGVTQGNAHYPLLRFFQSHPDYQYYWFIEYDVRYTGIWRHLFASFKEDDTDFIASHITPFHQESDWPHWKLLHPSKTIPLTERIRSFNPIYRISNAALEAVHHAHCEGWKGHNEVLFPSILYHKGYTISDFGGEGSFVPPERVNQFYLGKLTHRYRPNHENSAYHWRKIYHPVKPNTPTVWEYTLRDYIPRWITRFQYAFLKLSSP